MTGFESKRQAAKAKLYAAADTLSIVYQRGFADGKKAAQPEQQAESVAYDKTELNRFVQDLYDQKMQEGKHGHYETLFHVVHQAIKKVAPPAAQPEQQAEPVAWITPDGEGWRIRFSPPTIGVPLGWDALYTAAPAAQRPWQGLTDEDRRKFAAAQYGWEDLLIAAEAKLKERNGY